MFIFPRNESVIIFPLQATLSLSEVPKEIVGEPLDTNRLYDAVNVLISLHVEFFFGASYSVFDQS